MPPAREALLSAALTALADRPWSAVRMVDVAAAAGVSRQTLYNEFGSKEGLARALVRRETDRCLLGVDRALARGAATGEPLVSLAEWFVREADERPLLRALLTGAWAGRLPPALGADRDAVPAPARLVALVRDRSAAALDAEHGPETARACELAVRIALAHLVAPDGQSVGRLVRSALRRA